MRFAEHSERAIHRLCQYAQAKQRADVVALCRLALKTEPGHAWARDRCIVLLGHWSRK